MIPEIEITDGQPNFDGFLGMLVAVRGPSTLDETIIDLPTGAFIGGRETDADGTVIVYNDVRSSIVGALGQT